MTITEKTRKSEPMNIIDIALKNLTRRKGKASFILAGLAIGVATVVGVICYTDTMTRDINHKLEKYGANIIVVPQIDNLSLSYGGMTLGGITFETSPIKQAELDLIRKIKNAENIAAVGPMTIGKIQINGQSALLAGIEYDAMHFLKPWWKISGRPPKHDELLVGIRAAEHLGLKPGQPITLNGRKLIISGLLMETGSQDDHLLFTPLTTAQNVLHKAGEITMVEIAALCHACPVDDMVAQIAEKLPMTKVMAIQQVVKGRMETFTQFRNFSFGLSVLIVFIGGLVVLVTLMGSVKERKEEIGIFRAIGFRQKHIMQIIFIETGMISVIAGLVGFSTAVCGVYTILSVMGRINISSISFDPRLAAGAIAISVIIGMLASAYPAFQASRMDPNRALKSL